MAELDIVPFNPLLLSPPSVAITHPFHIDTYSGMPNYLPSGSVIPGFSFKKGTGLDRCVFNGGRFRRLKFLGEPGALSSTIPKVSIVFLVTTLSIMN